MYTDACVYPYPSGDTTVCRFAHEARSRGFSAIVSAGASPCQRSGGVKVIPATIIRVPAVKDLLKFLKQKPRTGGLLMVEAGDAGFNRTAIAAPGVHVLRGVHHAPRRSFDHITARYAAEHLTAVNISLHPVIHSRGIERQKALVCYADILRLHRRFEFPLTISTDARSWTDLRSAGECIALTGIFGMEEGEAEAALSSIGHLLQAGLAVEEVR
ncbi:MAG: RNase P subunit p30 family protein [Methanomicrobiaceae archaeon]|nr:RNase P subunit p30 family protein [Methanomicrobiaceae archaeon]